MNELVKSNAAIAPIANMNEFLALAQEFEKSGMFGCTQPGQGAVLLSTCMTDKISPIEFIRTYHLIEGRPSMRADAMLAKFVQQGGRYKILEFSENKAAGVFSLGDNEVTMSMTMQEAEAAGLTKSKAGKVKDNWRSFPRQMLWARVVSSAIRLVAPQIVAGVYTPEEVQDFDKEHAHEPPAIRVEGVDVTLPGVPQQAAEEPQQQETAQPDLLPDDAAETGNADANICPCGTVKGKAWKELDTGVLNTVLHSQHPAVKASMTSAHYIALKEELRSRGMG
jgi:hypothetical protein